MHMKKIPILLLSLISFSSFLHAQIELSYAPAESASLPEWVQLMYQDHADIGQVLEALGNTIKPIPSSRMDTPST